MSRDDAHILQGSNDEADHFFRYLHAPDPDSPDVAASIANWFDQYLDVELVSACESLPNDEVRAGCCVFFT